MARHHSLPIALFSSLILLLPASYGQGAKHEKTPIRQQDRDYYEQMLRYNRKSAVRPQYSLREYCPEAGDQGNTQTCTAWAAVYGALSTEYAIQENSISSKRTFSPWYTVHFLTTMRSLSCNSPLAQYEVLEELKTNGACLAKNLSVQDQCRAKITEFHRKEAEQYRIQDYRLLFDIDYHESIAERIDIITRAIHSNHPVILGVGEIYQSFKQLSGKEYWEPKSKKVQISGKHSLLVVGYDKDNFEVMNSWGSSWGRKGFAKVPKTTLAKWAFNAFILLCGQEQSPLELGYFVSKRNLNNNIQRDTINWESDLLSNSLTIHLQAKSLFQFPIRTTWSATTQRKPLIISLLKTAQASPVLVKANYLSRDTWMDIPGADDHLYYDGKKDTLVVLISYQDHQSLAPSLHALQQPLGERESIEKVLYRQFPDAKPVKWQEEGTQDKEKRAIISYNWAQPSINYFYIVLHDDDS